MEIRIISPFDRNVGMSQNHKKTREKRFRKKKASRKRQKIAHPSHLFTLRDKEIAQI